MEAAAPPQSKHRNLQHRLNPGVKERAAEHLGSDASAAGLKILEMRQRDMQELFGKVFGVPTKSSNNEWLRSKLLQAVGLPPRWRPAPSPPPSPPSDSRPGEFSRFGRRLRATAVPRAVTAGIESDDDDDDESGEQEEEEEEEEEAEDQSSRRRPAKRPRQSAQPRSSSGGSISGGSNSGGSSRSASRSGSPLPQAQAQAIPAAVAPAGPRPSSSDDSSGNAAILSLQARAAAAFAALPAAHFHPVVLQPPAVPAVPGGVPSMAPSMRPPAAAPAAPAPQPPALAAPLPLPLLPASANPNTITISTSTPQLAGLSLQPPPSLPSSPAPAPAPAVASTPLRSVRVPLPPQCAPERSQALAALLSDPLLAAPAQPPSPTPLLQMPSLRLPLSSASCSLSAQLHRLFNDWDEGLLSFGAL